MRDNLGSGFRDNQAIPAGKGPVNRGVGLQRMITDLDPLLRGWAGYFGFSQERELPSLDGWIRRCLRCAAWVQWKTRPRRFDELRRPGLSRRTAFTAVMIPSGPTNRRPTNHTSHPRREAPDSSQRDHALIQRSTNMMQAYQEPVIKTIVGVLAVVHRA